MRIRVGLGQDAHTLVEGRPLIIGGIGIEHARGLRGHSDADVLTHAVIDALLGAANLGTIGEHFPDTDDRYRGVSSLELLDATRDMIDEAGWRVGNIDGVITAQAPRMRDHLRPMARTLAQRLGVSDDSVSVKATSPEGVGALGRGESIAASVVALLLADDGRTEEG
ncbi:MAG TPA: 2-C-methyl-D-erythritol 2,4-cyclodiphosphate synthase [Candidatus Dormibacteraeota bacterium]|nr:2-C-methyl-D-erythritol 2,4-cyclodiphosphate synthase [Candidatus Dormibacteraeota bacterium]